MPSFKQRCSAALLVVGGVAGVIALKETAFGRSRITSDTSLLGDLPRNPSGLPLNQSALRPDFENRIGRDLPRPLSTQLERVPAGELLAALGLHQPEDQSQFHQVFQREWHGGSALVRIETEARKDPSLFPEPGLSVLQYELSNYNVFQCTSFDLLYNPQGHLISIFPVFPEEVIAGILSAPDPKKAVQILKPRYFDLSPYYFEIPQIGDPGAKERWFELADSNRKDQELIRDYVDRYCAPLVKLAPNFTRQMRPFNSLEMDRETGEWRAFNFELEDFERYQKIEQLGGAKSYKDFERLFGERSHYKEQVVIPRFPTVYTHVHRTKDELAYLKAIYRELEISPEDQVLIVGPGTGADSWLASFRTDQPIYTIGINPLEVANTRVFAQIAGFEVIATVNDNIVSDSGEPRFPETRFQWVFWNMPYYIPQPSRDTHATLVDLWDGDVGGAVLKRYASGLSAVFAPDGQSLVWNYAYQEDGKNVVAEILKAGGEPLVEADRMPYDVRVASFRKQITSYDGASSLLKGHLYYISPVY